jgi:cell fate (sporulation/competence/biofilm development) regulator YlbF (YheA/YmcA/DUF963 family)
MASAQEQRNKLEQLEQLDALRRREDEIQQVIAKIESPSK